MSTSLRPTTRLSYDQEAVDAFFEKMTRIEGLDEGIRGLTSIDEVRKTFQQMTEGVSGLFDATLKEKVRCARAGQLPTAEGSSYLFEERSQATISRISRTFVEILDGLPPVNRASAAENGFAAEAYQWLSLFQPRHERLFRLKSAIRFFEIGDGPKAKESLKSIVSLFPEQVKEEFSKLIFQETPTPDGLAGLRKGLFDNYRAVASSLVREDRAASAPKRWDDILMNSAFIIPIVGEFTFEELLEGRFPDLEKLPERVLPHGFLDYVQREYTFFPDPSFSTRILAMHPDLTRLGFFAMMKKGSDYALLSERLKRNAALARLAIASVLADSPSDLVDLLRHIPEDVPWKETIPGFIDKICQKIAAKSTSTSSEPPSALNAGRPRIPPLRLLGARNAKAIQTAVRECAAHYGLAKGEGLPLLPLIRLLSVRNPEVTQAAVQECAANRWLDSGASNVERFFLPLQLCSNDSETMWFAVRQYAMSVQYADQAMEEYEEMARFAVQQSGWALRVVRADLKDDEGLVRIAEQQDKQIRLFASERVQQILSKRS